MSITLNEVQSFAYLKYDNLSTQGVLTAIANSPDNLIIIGAEPGVTLNRSQADPSGAKIFLGYVDVAEASSVNNPDLFGGGPLPAWFGNQNPNFPGVYSVQYWNPAWETELFANIDKIATQGFDGIYLDVANGASEWLPGNAEGNTPVSTPTLAMTNLLADIRAHVNGLNLDHPFYIVAGNPDPSALASVDGIINDGLYFHDAMVNGQLVSVASSGQLAAQVAAAYNASGLPVLGHDYSATGNLAQEFQSFAAYAAQGWVPSVSNLADTLGGLSSGPVMFVAVATNPTVRGVENAVNFLSGGTTDNVALIAGDQGDYLMGGPGANTIAGGAGNDTIYAHPASTLLADAQDNIDGGGGINTVVYSHPSSAYTITPTGGGSYTVALTAGGHPDSLANIQNLQFSDGTQIVDTTADVLSELATLQPKALQKSILGITLTDGTPVISVTDAQAATGPDALRDISGIHTFAIDMVDQNATVTGVTSFDTAVFSGNFSDYTIGAGPNGQGVTVTNTAAGGNSTDHLSNIELAQFADFTMFVTTPAEAQIALLYQGALGRTPDIAGLVAWQNLFATEPASAQGADNFTSLAGTSVAGLPDLAYGFTQSTEFQNKYGALTDAQFVTQLYANVLDRAPDQGGLDAWTGFLGQGHTREWVLVGFVESAEAYHNAEIGYVGQTGTQHTPWLAVT